MALRSVLQWTEKAEDNEGNPRCIYDLAFSPDGRQLIAAAGSLILVCDAETGALQRSLKGHKENVHSLCYNREGTRFVSGSSDRFVIIWDSTLLTGCMKYSHGDSIQCVAYSPVSSVVLSCSVSDIGLWMTDGTQKSVSKHKVPSRVCCCSWTNDGQFFSLGHYNGTITIWSKNGDEKIKIDRQNSAPVWTMSFNPSREDRYDILSVCDWGQCVSHYHLSGKQVGKDRNLGFDPLFFSYYGNGEYTLVGGSNKRVLLCSRDGAILAHIGEEQTGWVWSCRYRPGAEGSIGGSVAMGTQDGKILLYRLGFNTVHGLYKDRYAYRDNLTDVVVQNLVTNDRARLRCNDLVKKIAIYKTKLAVQLPERILVFEAQPNNDLCYVVKEKITKKIECSLMVVCSNNIVLCMERKLQCMALNGDIEREWPLQSQIRYIKVVGGPPGREALLAGLRNGQIFKLFVDNPFPVNLMKISTVIRCLDLSASRNKVAIVDESSVLMVYDLTNNQLLYQEPNANSVAWNTHREDMLCFSGEGMLSIKASNFPAHKHRQLDGQGFVVGFTGSKIFSLHCFNMTANDVPLSAPMIQYLERKQYCEAYNVACLGVTNTDWNTLAMESLEGMDFITATKAFTRLKDLRYLELISRFEERKRLGEDSTALFLAEIYAYQGKFQEAARLYKSVGQSQKAVDMYTQLRMFDLAREFMRSRDQENMKALIAQQADWAKTTNDSEAACEMYLAAGDYSKAITIMGENGWIQRLVDISNELNKPDRESLRQCAQHLKRLGEFTHAEEVYRRMGDYTALASLYVERQLWEQAFELVETTPDLKDVVYIPYATWLIDNDRFDEAQEALSKAGKRSEAVNFLQQLADNAINEKRYEDAGYYHWLLARTHLSEAQRQREEEQQGEEEGDLVSRFHWHIEQAELYHVYHSIHRYLNQPFTSQLAEALFNMSRYLVHKLMQGSPPGISRVAALFTLAKQSRSIGAYKLARYAYDKLQSLKVPAQFQDSIDLGSLTIRSKPFQDKEDLLPLCYRCSTTNPLLNTSGGNTCVTCRQPFVFSFVSFEVLPLVEFILEDGISDEEAMKLIKMEPPRASGMKETPVAGVDVLQFNDDTSTEEDPFNERLTALQDGGEYCPVMVDKRILQMMHRREVLVKQWCPPLRHQYYRSLLPDVIIRLCDTCNQMFHADDYELQVLCKGHCPFCREPAAAAANTQ